jgi:hypothetical protein
MSKAAELAALIGSQTALSNRNLIINGAMQVAQRATSKTNVGPNGTGEGYTVLDRFQISLSGDQVSTFSQSTDAPSGFSNSAKIEVTTADTSLASTQFWHLRYAFEGRDLQSLAKGTSDAKPFTVSFYVKSNKTGVYTVGLFDTDNNRQNALSYTINSSNTWERKSLTFNPDTTGAFDNDNNMSLRLNFALLGGADLKSGTFFNGTWGGDVDANAVHPSQVNLADTVGNEWYITGVQMEVGEQATPFEHRSFADELARCQRYYQVSGSSVNSSYNVFPGQRWSSNNIFFSVPIATSMRANPTIGSDVSGNFGFVGGNNQSKAFSLSEMNFVSLDSSSITARVTVDFTPNSAYAYTGYFNTAGELQLDAEL